MQGAGTGSPAGATVVGVGGPGVGRLADAVEQLVGAAAIPEAAQADAAVTGDRRGIQRRLHRQEQPTIVCRLIGIMKIWFRSCEVLLYSPKTGLNPINYTLVKG